ncbi:hypothetical protein Tco_0441448 [Tanacetum coccineum]
MELKNYELVAIALAYSEASTPESKLATTSTVAKGTLLGTYEDIKFKSPKSNKSVLKSVDLFGLRSGPELEKKLKFTEQVCTGVILAKELIAATYIDVITAKILDKE